METKKVRHVMDQSKVIRPDGKGKPIHQLYFIKVNGKHKVKCSVPECELNQ